MHLQTTTSDIQLDLGYVKPTAMLGQVMELQLLQNPLGFLVYYGYIQLGGPMCGEPIQHSSNDTRAEIRFVRQPLQFFGQVLHGMLLGNTDVASDPQWFERYVQVGDPISPVLVAAATWLFLFERLFHAHITDLRPTPLIMANEGTLGIARQLIQVQNIIRESHLLDAGLWDALHLFLPGL